MTTNHNKAAVHDWSLVSQPLYAWKPYLLADKHTLEMVSLSAAGANSVLLVV